MSCNVTGMILGEPCPDCGHLVGMHDRLHGCEVCAMREKIEANIPNRRSAIIETKD